MFFSQQNEDRILFEKYLNFRDGFFIELGAMDGIQYSNTLFFEKELNWRGVLIEPTQQYNFLEKNRPLAHNFNLAVSEKEGEIEFLGNGALGGMIHTMPDWHKFGWHLDKQNSYKVKSKPISKILENLNIERVDFFSIDVEGGEIEVLKTFDWSIPVYVILIEGEYTIPKDENIRKTKHSRVTDEEWSRIDGCTQILLDNGFQYIEDIGCNQVWINQNNKRK